MLTRFQLQRRAGKTACLSARIGTGLLKASSGSSRLTALRLSTQRPACGDVEATYCSYKLLDAQHGPRVTSFAATNSVSIVHGECCETQVDGAPSSVICYFQCGGELILLNFVAIGSQSRVFCRGMDRGMWPRRDRDAVVVPLKFPADNSLHRGCSRSTCPLLPGVAVIARTAIHRQSQRRSARDAAAGRETHNQGRADKRH